MQGFVTFPRTFAWSNAWVAWKAAPAFGRNWNAFPPTLTRIFVVSASDSPLGQNWFRSMEPATFRSPCGMRPPMLGLLGYEVKNRSRESRTANHAGQEVQRPNQRSFFWRTQNLSSTDLFSHPTRHVIRLQPWPT